MPVTRVPFHRFLARSILAVAALGAAAPSAAQPVLGFTEDFPGTSTSSWMGGSLFSNPGTGGWGGSADGYLDVSTPSPSNLGTVSFGPEYAGDWAAAGITQVVCWLRDTGGTGVLEIHLSIGDGLQTWQHDAGFLPPAGAWGRYAVDLVPSGFTRIRGTSGTFAGTLSAVDRLHFRHDLAPYGPTPDPVQGAFGLDHLQLTTGASVDVPAAGPVARPVLLAPPYPNPARGRVTLQVQQPEPGPVSLTILDAAGRRVRHVELDAGSGAPRLWLWDGSGDDGRPLPAGVYRVLARGDNGGTSRTVTLLR